MKKLILFLILFVCNSSFSDETTLLLIRHGETDWNLELKIQGSSDVPLNDTGISQAVALAEVIAIHHPDIIAIYSSDLERAYHTAQKSANKLGLEISSREALRERHGGEAEGLSYKESDERYGKLKKELSQKCTDDKWRCLCKAVPGEESFGEVFNRAYPELLNLAKKHPGQKIAVFTHGAVIRTIIGTNEKAKSRSVNNCSVAEFRLNSEEALEFVDLHDLIQSTL